MISLIKGILKPQIGEGTVSLSSVAAKDDGNLLYSLDWSHNGLYIAGSGLIANKQVIVYSFDGTTISEVESINLGADFYSCAWHPTTEYLAVGGALASNQIKVYSWNGTNTLTEVETINHGDTVTSIDWHPNGNYLAVSGNNTSKEVVVYSWNGTDTLTEVESLNLGATGGNVKWSNSGNYLARRSAETSKDLAIYSWNGTDTLTEAAAVSLGAGYNNVAPKPSWSINDDYIFIGTSDATKTTIYYSFDGSSLTEENYIGYGVNFRSQPLLSKYNKYLFDIIFDSTLTRDWVIAYEWDVAAKTLTQISALNYYSWGGWCPVLNYNQKYIAYCVYRQGGVDQNTIKIGTTNLRG